MTAKNYNIKFLIFKTTFHNTPQIAKHSKSQRNILLDVVSFPIHSYKWLNIPSPFQNYSSIKHKKLNVVCFRVLPIRCSCWFIWSFFLNENDRDFISLLNCSSFIATSIVAGIALNKNCFFSLTKVVRLSNSRVFRERMVVRKFLFFNQSIW